MYEISPISQNLHNKLIIHLKKEAPEILNIDMDYLTRGDFWVKEPKKVSTLDGLDLRTNTEIVLREFIKENTTDLIKDISNLSLINKKQSSFPRTLYIYLPRILVTLPESIVPDKVKSIMKTTPAGFLNTFISERYRIASYFLDHPPHIDLVDYPDGKKDCIYTMLVPLNMDVKEENGGIFFSDSEWVDKSMVTDRLCLESLKQKFSQYEIKLGEKGVWDERQPHSLLRNSLNKPLIMFRICFSLKLNDIPALRSEVLKITSD